MKLLALCVFAVSTCVPSAPGAGCAPIDCGASQTPLAHGTLLAVHPNGITGPVRVLDLRTGRLRVRLPDGILGGSTLVHIDGKRLTWLNAPTGARIGTAVAHVRGNFILVGASQSGNRAVLMSKEPRSTTFELVSRAQERRVVIGGTAWGFDALSGDKLYLLQYLNAGYVVRLYDLATNKLAPQILKDKSESALILGVPWVRLSSADGRYVFTLYITNAGSAMVHELDTRSGTARCIDLPGKGDFTSATGYTLTRSADGSTLWAVSPGYGKVAAVDVAAARVHDSFDFTPNKPASPLGDVAALSQDGQRLAVADGSTLFFVSLAQRRVVTAPGVAIALGFSPDGRRLWTLGQRSRVTAMRVP
jgi:hypothetical protein